ncbi:hypothetical protein SDC9_211525 [bioreactor metagenome]|uniref:Uncharacterized protein n=1 Tax=bioreactor metagenome TaxID=1076179 RepID=A0A645JM05_9ZZZZ
MGQIAVKLGHQKGFISFIVQRLHLRGKNVHRDHRIVAIVDAALGTGLSGSQMMIHQDGIAFRLFAVNRHRRQWHGRRFDAGGLPRRPNALLAAEKEPAKYCGYETGQCI